MDVNTERNNPASSHEANPKAKQIRRKENLTTILLLVLAFVLTFFTLGFIWMMTTWSNMTIYEIIYHLKSPLQGTGDSMVSSFILKVILPDLAVTLGIGLIFYLIKGTKPRRLTRIILPCACLVSFIITGTYLCNWLEVPEYLTLSSETSTFVDDHYRNPDSEGLVFPSKKRNVVMLFLESMETTYSDTADGGAFPEDVIPELTEMAKTGEDFSGTDPSLNGANVLPGTGWTIASVFAQTSGLPLLIPVSENSMSEQTSFFPNTQCLGDILKSQGYTQELLLGSDGSFGGRSLYFSQHGGYAIEDYNYALEQGWIPEGYKVWWGYEDSKLFQFARNRLTALAAEDKPFNLTMLTVDTHFEDGYLCPECPTTFGDNQYANVMACSSRQVSSFLAWMQTQDFYKDTSVVIVGDHPTMDADFCNAVPSDYVRKSYVAYLNSAVSCQDPSLRRDYSPLDTLPTTLASMGVTIPDETLGLGVNLFSSSPTLIEEYGLEDVKTELLKKSELIDTLFSN
jgi:phosphoglycerol transferase